MQRQVCRTPSPRSSPNVGARATRCLYNNDHLIFVASGVRSSENLLTLRCAGRHALAAARPGADQHKPADKLRLGERELLRDEAAEREADHVDLGGIERLDKGGGVGRHLLHRGRNVARAAGDTCVVE
jgi:hypothetical protein